MLGLAEPITNQGQTVSDPDPEQAKCKCDTFASPRFCIKLSLAAKMDLHMPVCLDLRPAHIHTALWPRGGIKCSWLPRLFLYWAFWFRVPFHIYLWPSWHPHGVHQL